MRSAFACRIAGVALAGSGIAWALPAAAQTAEAAAEVSAASEDTGVIIVTARRREESLMETPVAITAVSAATLENRAAVNIGDLTGAAPNLLITQQNSGAAAANLSIRGLTYADIEKSQTPTVGVVIDGVTIGTNTGQLVDAFDIAQIEVLRGPQGTLFGANTIGGVLNIRRTRPTKEMGAKLEGSYSRWDTWNTKGIINLGAGGIFGTKLWYMHNQTDGFYHNATFDERAGWSKGDNYGASFLIEPDGGDFDALLTVEQVEQKFEPVVSSITNSSEAFCSQAIIDAIVGVPGVVLAAPAEQCNRNSKKDIYTIFGDNNTRSKYRAPNVTLEMNAQLGAVKLTSITGWRHSKENQTQDYDATSRDFYRTLRVQDYTQWSQELRGAAELIDGLDVVAGGYWFNSKYDLHQDTWFFGGLTDPQTVNGKSESFAVFADFNWSVTDTVRVSFGGRWSHDNKKLTNSYEQQGLIGSGDANFSKFTPKIGVDWRPNDEMMFYASWSRGYRSGGFSPRAATADTASTPFRPETVDAYEVGAKLNMFDRKAQLNFAAFYSDYKNMQQNNTVPGGPQGNQTITSNVGGAKIKGLEFDGTFRVSDYFKITATAAYMDSNFNDFIVGGTYLGQVVPFDYSDNRLIYAPKFSGSLEGQYELPTSFGSVVATAGVRHISPYDEQISAASLTPVLSGATVTGVVVNGNDPRVRTVTQDLVDASVTVNFDIANTEAYFRVFGRNLADIRTTTHAFTVAGLWSFGMGLEPRTYGATLGIRF